jgi:hypothetical protein
LKHLIRFSAKSVDDGNLVGAVSGVFRGKILERGISRAAIGLRLLDQSQRVLAPKTIRLELGLLQSCRRIFLHDIERGEITVKTGRVRLDLEPFAEHFLRVLVPTGTHGQPAQVIPQRSHKRV